MIRAVIFDVDGTLVQTEKLKARSYAIAVQQLLELDKPDERAIDAYREVVGAGRDTVSRHVMEELSLKEYLLPLTDRYNVTSPEEVLTEMRLAIYRDMTAKPEVIQENRWPHTVDLLRTARENACLTALATMSRLNDTLHVVHSLGISEYLDLILTAEDVRNPKPDPEIYLLAAGKLDFPPGECLALEDSVNGVRAALAAGTNVIALATPFSGVGLHLSEVIEDVRIVHKPEELAGVVRSLIMEHNQTAYGNHRSEKGGA